MNRDWFRLLPRKTGLTDTQRVAYLVEFLRHKHGSEKSKQKAIKELKELSKHGR